MMESRPPPPVDEGELMIRAERVAGRTIAQVADRFGLPVPVELRRHKGWIGQFLEYVLGASAASRAEPDFPHLGVELKSIPVDERAHPRESTYVCVAPLNGSIEKNWEESWVRRKLSRVLFIPIVGEGPVGDRRIGAPVLWAPDEIDRKRLRDDWEEITERIMVGDLTGLHGRVGEVLQLRPKGASGSDATWALNEDAEWVETMARGFYLRRSFTAELLHRAFGLA